MDTEAVKCYLTECNCSQCILKAAERHYGISISMDAYNMCRAMSSGFGIGGFCNALAAGVMLFGLLADENTAKSMRLRLLADFDEKYHSFDCAGLISKTTDGECVCNDIIRFIAGKIKEILDSEEEVSAFAHDLKPRL